MSTAPDSHPPAASHLGGRPAPWWTSAVVYQVYPRSFADSDGDGVGDIPGITAHLDHLADLGVDVLWLSPVYSSPQDDNGYDISDYYDVDPTFGTLADLDALIAGLHERGMKLVMDLVVNHTSDEHPWFVESRAPGSPKRNWYWWRPPRPGTQPGEPGAEPTNWASFFTGPAWELDETSGEYYLHLFSRKQPDLDWENPEVRAAVHSMMRWWLDRGVDGFRMDVVNFLSKDVAPDGSLPDGPVRGPGPLGDGSAAFVSGPRIHEFLHEMHQEVFAERLAAGAQLLTVGEMPGVTVEDGVLFTDPARAEVDMVFQFDHVNLDQGETQWDLRPVRLRDLKDSLGRWQTALAERGWNSLYWGNHDQPRPVSRFGDDSPEHRTASATCLATLLHLHRGTPYVYQGEELGMANSPFTSITDYRDLATLNHHRWALQAGEDEAEVLAAILAKSRDHARTPMQWDASAGAGFTTGTPWIAVNPDHATVNAAAQRDDPASVMAHYRRLIALRHDSPTVALGHFTMLLPEHDQVYAFTRSLGEEVLVVLCNVGGTPVPLSSLADDLPGHVAGGLAGAEVVLGNLPGSLSGDGSGGPPDADLRPWEARVLRLAGGAR